MSDPLQAYYAEVRAAEDEYFNLHCRGGGPIGVSLWSANLELLRQIDDRHGVQPEDPRVYSIAAYQNERRQIDEEWAALLKARKWDRPDLDESAGRDKGAAQWRHETRIADCTARHFPGLNGLHPRTIDSIPKLWAYITEHLSGILERHYRLLCRAPAGARPTTCDENVRQVYSLLHELQVPWAPEPPYLALTQPEVLDQLKRIANRLERDEAERGLAPPLAPPDPPTAAEETPAEGAAPAFLKSESGVRPRLAPLVGQIIGESQQGFQPATVRLLNDTRGNAPPGERIADLARLLHSSVGRVRPALVRAGYIPKEAAELTRQLMAAAGRLLVDGPSRASLSGTEDFLQHEMTAISLANRIDDDLNTAAGAIGLTAPAPATLRLPQAGSRPRLSEAPVPSAASCTPSAALSAGAVPPGSITLSPDSQPISTFIEAADQAIRTEYLRIHQLWRYDPDSAESHEEWMRLHAEHKKRALDLGSLGAEAIRAGRLAGETARTGELVRKVTDLIRGLEGWVGEWWRLHGDRYREWLKRRIHRGGTVKTLGGASGDIPPELIDAALPLLRRASEAMCALTNDLIIIAIGVPLSDPPPAVTVEDGRPAVADERAADATPRQPSAAEETTARHIVEPPAKDKTADHPGGAAVSEKGAQARRDQARQRNELLEPHWNAGIKDAAELRRIGMAEDASLFLVKKKGKAHPVRTRDGRERPREHITAKSMMASLKAYLAAKPELQS